MSEGQKEEQREKGEEIKLSEGERDETKRKRAGGGRNKKVHSQLPCSPSSASGRVTTSFGARVSLALPDAAPGEGGGGGG